MEEELKILEEFKKNGYSMLVMKYGDRNKANLKLENALENLIKRYKELEQENKEYEETLDIFDNREYRKRYLEERRAEEPNLLYPDADEIYKRYYELLEEIKNSIPKSKIEEYMDKIQKELDKRKVKGMYIAVDGDIADTDINTWIIQRATLKELLESEENE